MSRPAAAQDPAYQATARELLASVAESATRDLRTGLHVISADMACMGAALEAAAAGKGTSPRARARARARAGGFYDASRMLRAVLDQEHGLW